MDHQHPRKHLKCFGGNKCWRVHTFTGTQLCIYRTNPNPNHIDWLDSLRPSSIATNTKSIQTYQRWPYNHVISIPGLWPHSVQSQMLRNDGNSLFSPKFTKRRTEQRVRDSVPSSFDFRHLRPTWLWSTRRPPLYSGGPPQPPEGSLQLLQNHLLCLFTSSIKIHGYSPTSQQRGLCSKISVSVPQSHFR